MVKALLLVVAVVLGGVAWLQQGPGPAGPGGQASAPAAGLAMNQAASGPAPVGGSGASASASGVSTGAAGVTVTAAGNTEVPMGKRIAELGMTRQLAGDHLLMLEGRQRRVLGTKEVTGVGGDTETMLLVRDEVSGQISYHKPGLQFTLKDGTDTEAFIRDHPRQRRLFVNTIYAQVAVDAADIAAEYTALAGDPRVVKLRFMNREAVRTPK